MSYVAIQSLRKTYQSRKFLGVQRTEALKGIDCVLPQGSITVILGRNGAGKTTFMNICAGLLCPTSGTVTIQGKAPAQMLTRIGYLPEFIYVPEYLTVSEFIVMMGRLSGISEAVLSERKKILLEQFELTAEGQKRIGSLSMGNKRRLLIVHSLLHDPDVLILDEPTVYLDFLGKDTFYEFLLTLRRRGCTILVSSHILSDIEKLGDRLLILKEGAITHSYTRQELEAQKDLEHFIVSLLKYEKN